MCYAFFLFCKKAFIFKKKIHKNFFNAKSNYTIVLYFSKKHIILLKLSYNSADWDNIKFSFAMCFTLAHLFEQNDTFIANYLRVYLRDSMQKRTQSIIIFIARIEGQHEKKVKHKKYLTFSYFYWHQKIILPSLFCSKTNICLLRNLVQFANVNLI